MHFLSVGKIESKGETYYEKVQSLGGWCVLRVQLQFLFFKNYLLCVVSTILWPFTDPRTWVSMSNKEKTEIKIERQKDRRRKKRKRERERRRNINQDSIKEEKAHTYTGCYWRWTEPWRKSNGREINEKNIEEYRKGWNIQRQKDGNAKKQLKMKTVWKGGKIKIDRKNNTVKNKINKSQII